MSGLADTFAALSEPTRLGVVRLLQSGPCRAGELAEALEIAPPALSRHLRVLRTSGLVEETHDGADARVRVYRLRAQPFAELRRWLDEVEAFWAGQLASFKAHAERTARPSAPDPSARPSKSDSSSRPSKPAATTRASRSAATRGKRKP